jgi:hypothetical protein
LGAFVLFSTLFAMVLFAQAPCAVAGPQQKCTTSM